MASRTKNRRNEVWLLSHLNIMPTTAIERSIGDGSSAISASGQGFY